MDGSGKQERGPQMKIRYFRRSKLPLWLHFRKSDRRGKPEYTGPTLDIYAQTWGSGLPRRQGEAIWADATVLVPCFLFLSCASSIAPLPVLMHNLDCESPSSPLEDLNTASLQRMLRDNGLFPCSRQSLPRSVSCHLVCDMAFLITPIITYFS